MPWRQPDSWITAEVLAPIMSFVVAYIRSHYDGSEPSWKRKVLEALLCGSATLTAGFAIKAVSASGDWVYAIGGVVGLFGVDYVRSVGRRVVNSKAGKL